MNALTEKKKAVTWHSIKVTDAIVTLPQQERKMDTAYPPKLVFLNFVKKVNKIKKYHFVTF